jgi:hypothetical protein
VENKPGRRIRQEILSERSSAINRPKYYRLVPHPLRGPIYSATSFRHNRQKGRFAFWDDSQGPRYRLLQELRFACC